ncbi:GTPase IMAP family member 8-like isoform X5 [Stegastes partitus]|uniref:GTPase IMAP family member 8-like isoform X5 n=2 Tax=Stegastes partitus TaxID=144197 RepID=A0A9Y4TRJ6_9TELE|nr:PREDICTED: GTPase IMAP family member 8-like isoform X5 [Stegastes partitus]
MGVDHATHRATGCSLSETQTLLRVTMRDQVPTLLHHVQQTCKVPAIIPLLIKKFRGESNGLRSGDTFNIVLLGLTGTGKSASGNTILTAMNPHLKPKQLFESRPSSIPITTKCQFKTIRSLYSRRVGVVDTPDFLNDEINDQAQVEECKKFCQPGHYVVLLVIQMGRFTEGEKGMLERLEMKLDCRIRENTIVLLTHGENAKGNVQSFIDERSHLRHIVNECGNRCHVFKNTSKEPKQVMELFKKIPDYETIFPEFTEKQSLIGCRVG